MNYPQALYRKLKSIPKITSMFPLLHQVDDSTLQCKDGSLVSLIELQGLDYTGMNDEQYAVNFLARKRIFEMNNPFINVDVISRKAKVKASDRLAHSGDNQALGMLVNAWKKNFSSVFRTRHYVVVTVGNGRLLEKVGRLVSSDYRVDKHDLLSSTIADLMSQLKDYNPKTLRGFSLPSFYATLLTGRETLLYSRNWDEPLADYAIDFDASQSHCTYGRNQEAIHAAWFTINRYPSDVTQETLERLFRLPVTFNVYQSFKSYTKNESLALIDDKVKQSVNFGGITDKESDDIIEFYERIQGDLSALIKHSLVIEVLNPSLEALEFDARLVRETLTSGNELKVYRESTNIEALFWARFPSQQHFNLRARDIASENASHLATFNSVGEGFDTCGFGARPVTLFKTVEGGQYSFTFHESPALKPDTLGHTAVFGGTDSGKSTLISFLIANCLSYDNFKAICFDRLQGLRVFTELFDGDYLDFPNDVKMNPFLMKDTAVNRMFLTSWLKRLGGIAESDNTYNQKIQDIINTNFSLPKDARNFKELEIAMGREGDDFHNRFQQWLPQGNRGGFFNGDRDSFNFDKSIVTFDATYILDQPEVLPHVTSYLSHQIRAQVSEKVTPHIVFFDESPRYLQEPIFAKSMLEFYKEERKQAGVVILAAQDPSTYRTLPNNVGDEIINSLAHIILFPNPTAKREDYIDFLGLNEREFQWIKDTAKSSRQVLVKQRSTGSSVVLDINLKSLNSGQYKLLNAFDSSASAVLRLKELKKSDPINWRLKYLRS